MSRILEKMMTMMIEGLISALILYFFAENFSQITRILGELFAKVSLSKLILGG
ncbi:MAG: hypothetical protein ACP5KW_03015 [Thermoproteota archaeon]|jgi:hypothetical protein